MYCKECGQQILNDSKFCKHCGTNQFNESSSHKKKVKTVIKDSAVSEVQINKLKKTFGSNISKKTIGYYLIWVLAHFVILLVNGDFKYDEDFWPITDFDIYFYDFSEFIIYTIVPLLLIYAISFFKNDEKVEKVKPDKYDFSYKRDFGFLAWGLIIMGLYMLYWTISVDFFYYNLNIADKRGPFMLMAMIIRIIATTKVIMYVGRLNRNKTGWGIFTFFIPLLSLILVSFQHKLKDKRSI